ncbi:amino acid permease-domain-containing protein [Thelonectria olida]|uniref:Amino acid permease-domain-containing protein n=1 Tax=Thelonectria olida TaxID=1576542 RepID=A0A9P8VUF3_9HYPO|nr:amino acid permease-domain-containing protein [Thelonectria olida]
MQGTHSTGASLLLWLAGSVYCLAGVHVYIEYGLNAPRYIFQGIEQSVPRSGGDLNYLQYVYRKPGYRNDTVLLSTCLFGVVFICLGNMAGNSISFAMRILGAAGNEDPSNGAVRGIALAAAVITCFIHTISRRGGIFLNNLLAIVKIMILLLIIVVAIIVAAGGLDTSNVIGTNTKPSKAFDNALSDANGYAQAFLAIIFAFSGFEQPNYVMGEISHPRRKHPISMIAGVSTVIVLYMAVNISYMVVVDFTKFTNDDRTTAELFFELTLGKIAKSNPKQGERIFNAFLAIASLGNIIVMTYTAARVKQEIAKEGIIPCAKFFAQDRDYSLGRLLKWFQKKGMFSSLLRKRWFSPDEHSERTPVGAFILHLVFVIILIFATWGMKPDDAYTLLTRLSAYAINAFFGVFLGLGILILRIRGPPPSVQVDDVPLQRPVASTWKEMTGRQINPILSVTCAIVYIAGGLWPIVTTWIKPTGDILATQTFSWYLVPTISWAVIAAGVVWFLGFVTVAWWTYRNYFKVFNVEKQPHFEAADAHDTTGETGGHSGEGLVLVHETVYISWVGEEIRQRKTGQAAFGNEMDEVPANPGLNDFAGTDFDAYYRQKEQQVSQQQFDAGYGSGFHRQ